MYKDNEKNFRESLKYEEDILANSSPKYSNKELRKIYQGREIKGNEFLNLDELYKQKAQEEKFKKYDEMIAKEKEEEAKREAEYAKAKAEAVRKRQEEYKRKLKKQQPKAKKILKPAAAVTLSALFAILGHNIIKGNSKRPITFQKAVQNGMNPQADLGIRENATNELNTIKEILEDPSKLTTTEAYTTLTMINSAYHDVLTDKVLSATNTSGTIKFGSRFEDGGTVEYVSINDRNGSDVYLKDSIVNSIVGEKTIPKSMANAISDYKETKNYIVSIQEGEQKSLGDTIAFCNNQYNKLDEFAAVQISFDGKCFNEHVITAEELLSRAADEKSSRYNDNQKNVQNALYPDNNNNNVQDVNLEYDDGR